MAPRASVLLLAVVVLLTPALAQFPPGNPITLEAEASEATVSTDEPASFTLTVTRTDMGPPEPFDVITEGQVTMTAADVPEGWTVSMEPSGFALAAGGSQTVTVTVSVTPDADADEAAITFTATFASPDPTGILVPGGSDTATVTVTRDESATRQLIETIGPGIWAILGALVVAIIVAVFLAVDARSHAVRLTTQATDVSVKPGQTASIPFWIENRGKDTDRFSLSANPGDDDWKAALPVTAVTLEPGQQEELHLAVTPHRQASQGSRGILRVVAVPDKQPKRIGVLAMTATVE